MDSELLQSLGEHLAAHGGAQLLDPQESERRRVLVGDRFALPARRVWWWEALPGGATLTTHYRSGDEGLELLLRLLPETAQPLWLFVTDDDPPPWRCIEGTAPVLVNMLREQRVFEYFVADPELTWLVFDTHHDTLVAYGEVFGRTRDG